jgi:hypothetical protein
MSRLDLGSRREEVFGLISDGTDGMGEDCLISLPFVV